MATGTFIDELLNWRGRGRLLRSPCPRVDACDLRAWGTRDLGLGLHLRHVPLRAAAALQLFVLIASGVFLVREPNPGGSCCRRSLRPRFSRPSSSTRFPGSAVSIRRTERVYGGRSAWAAGNGPVGVVIGCLPAGQVMGIGILERTW